jgi:endonuclease I
MDQTYFKVIYRWALVALALLCIPIVAQAQAPEGYYGDAADLEGTALRNALHDVIVNHEVYPYSSARFDVHDAIDVLDQDPTDHDRVLLLYSNAVAQKSSWPGYNREHVWPVSLGSSEHTPAHSDLHHIFACDSNVNSTRGNRAYDECVGDCGSHVEAPLARYSHRGWEPPDHQKGDVARALFYMDVRYEGDFGDEPDLRLVEYGVTPGCNCMGRLSKLRQWHQMDPVDARERARNDRVYELQENRNPFVDHPEWVEAIWDAPPVHLDSGLFIFDRVSVKPWINELHYENVGPDADEGVEIAGEAGTNLNGWTLLFYNGRDGRIYREQPLSGRIDDEGMGYGALWFSINNIQNGGADAVVLLNQSGEVTEFISYEGTLVATDGPADKMHSLDVGVAEFPQQDLGGSIQRVGKGGDPTHYRWAVEAHSRGLLNANQIILRTTRLPLIESLPSFLFLTIAY